MKNTKIKRIALFCLVLVVCAGSPVFSQTPPPAPNFSLGDLEKAINEFATNLAYSLPTNSSMGLNWSDAYIGNFPNFGAGFSFGFTTVDLGSFEDVLGMFDFSLPGFLTGFGGFPLPGYTVEGRLGGFVLPFDMGFKLGILPMSPGTLEKFDYFLIGGDVRYAVLKGNLILPKVSVSMGYSYMSGALGVKAGSDREVEYPDPDFQGGDLTRKSILRLGAPELTLPWSTSSLDFKAQISKSFGVVTPYLGIGASKGWSKAGYEVKTKIEDTGGHIGSPEQNAIFNALGIGDIDPNGFSSTIEVFDKWSGRLFGGLSFNMTVFMIDLTALWNFKDNQYGVTMGMRVQF